MPNSDEGWPRSSAICCYGLAILVFAAAFACVSLLGHVLQAAPPVSLFLSAVIFVAWFAGLGPALLTTALSVLAFGYFYLLPLNSLMLASRDLPRIVLFGIASLIIALISAAQRTTAASLRRARDQLQDAVQELRKNEAYLDHAQQLSNTGSFGWNTASGDIVWSKEAYRISGIERTVKPTLELMMQHVPPDDYEFVKAQLNRPLQGAKNLEFEHRWRTPDGYIKQLHVRARRVNYESGEEELVGALMDVTETRKAQKALADAQAQLAHANRVATLGELAASIAHEVNQPLAAIITNGEVSLQRLGIPQPKIDEVRRRLEQMIGAAERASNVVNRIRSLSRKIEPEQVLLDVNDVIQEVVKVVEREIASSQVSLRVELADALPPVLGDRIQLQQVILNLVVNGIQAMAEIDDRVRNLLIRSDRDQSDQVLVSVRDSGNGFDPANACRLFEAFYTTKPSGMGIGLSICRSIIEAHGGRIWACNHADGGAIVQFMLPTSHDGVSPSIMGKQSGHAGGICQVSANRP